MGLLRPGKPKPTGLFRPNIVHISQLPWETTVPLCWRICRFIGRTKGVIDYGQSLRDLSNTYPDWASRTDQQTLAMSKAERDALDGVAPTPEFIQTPSDRIRFARASQYALRWLGVGVDDAAGVALSREDCLLDLWPTSDMLRSYEYEIINHHLFDGPRKVLNDLRYDLCVEEANEVHAMCRSEIHKMDMGDVEYQRKITYMRLEDLGERSRDESNITGEIKALTAQGSIMSLHTQEAPSEQTEIHRIIENYQKPKSLPKGNDDEEDQEDPHDR
jgi:hypothetical protein